MEMQLLSICYEIQFPTEIITGMLQNAKVLQTHQQLSFIPETDYLLYSVNLEMKTQIFTKNKIAEQNIYRLKQNQLVK